MAEGNDLKGQSAHEHSQQAGAEHTFTNTIDEQGRLVQWSQPVDHWSASTDPSVLIKDHGGGFALH